MKHLTGLTLLELLTVMAMLAIFLTMGVPSLQQVMLKQEVSGEADRLVASLVAGRAFAVFWGRTVAVCPSMDQALCLEDSHWRSGWIVFIDDNADGARQPSEEIIDVGVEMRENVTAASSANRRFVRFLPEGFAFGSNATIAICDLDQRVAWHVVVANSGRPRSERAADTARCS